MSEYLDGWQNFYVIVGSAAGALIGLQFVVVALISTRRAQVVSSAMRAFSSPTIVFFSSVLFVAGLMNVPRHSRATLAASLIVVGVSGVGYVAWALTHLKKQESYAPDAGDWLWYVVSPALAYATLAAAGAVLWASVNVALVLAGASAMLLLLTGVHNAWDAAVWMVVNGPPDPDG